jgi:hypothetical protein
VDHDRDVIRIVERCRGTIESRIVKMPIRRGGLPDELREIEVVLVVAEPPALGGEVELSGVGQEPMMSPNRGIIYAIVLDYFG